MRFFCFLQWVPPRKAFRVCDVHHKCDNKFSILALTCLKSKKLLAVWKEKKETSMIPRCGCVIERVCVCVCVRERQIHRYSIKGAAFHTEGIQLQLTFGQRGPVISRRRAPLKIFLFFWRWIIDWRGSSFNQNFCEDLSFVHSNSSTSPFLGENSEY